MVFRFFSDCGIRTTAVEIVSVLQSKVFSLVLYFTWSFRGLKEYLKLNLRFVPSSH